MGSAIAPVVPGHPIHSPPERSSQPRRPVATPPEACENETQPPVRSVVIGRRFETIRTRGNTPPHGLEKRSLKRAGATCRPWSWRRVPGTRRALCKGRIQRPGSGTSDELLGGEFQQPPDVAEEVVARHGRDRGG